MDRSIHVLLLLYFIHSQGGKQHKGCFPMLSPLIPCAVLIVVDQNGLKTSHPWQKLLKEALSYRTLKHYMPSAFGGGMLYINGNLLNS